MKEQAGLSPSTIYSYTGCRKRVAPYLGHIQLKQLTPAAINKAYSDMLNAGVSKATVYQYHLFIHSMLATGCRIGEISALTWDNIDFESNRIHICRHFVCGKSGSQIVDGCKTNAGDRWLTLDESIMGMLREYRAYYLEKAESYGSKWNNGENAVFYAEKRYGRCINPDTVRAFLNSFTKKHGLKKSTPMCSAIHRLAFSFRQGSALRTLPSERDTPDRLLTNQQT